VFHSFARTAPLNWPMPSASKTDSAPRSASLRRRLDARVFIPAMTVRVLDWLAEIAPGQ